MPRTQGASVSYATRLIFSYAASLLYLHPARQRPRGVSYVHHAVPLGFGGGGCAQLSFHMSLISTDPLSAWQVWERNSAREEQGSSSDRTPRGAGTAVVREREKGRKGTMF
eukprot:3464570-Rhodomonas_salina.1